MGESYHPVSATRAQTLAAARIDCSGTLLLSPASPTTTMKRCPSCQRTFTDDLSFCVEDASALEDGGVRTLADLTHGGAPLAPRRAVAIAVSLCAALDPSRTRGRVPRGLTALDVELDGDTARVTLSLESAKPLRDAQTLDPAAPFSAPEALSEGEAITPATTVYNIAALLYQSLTGDTPFDASTDAAVAVRKLLEDAPSARALVPSLPADLDALLTRALDRAASERPQTPADFAALLRAIELPAETPAAALAQPPPASPAAFGAAPAPPSAIAAFAPSPAASVQLEATLAAPPPAMAAPPRSGAGRGLIIAGVIVALASIASLSLVFTARRADAPMSSSSRAAAPDSAERREEPQRSSVREPSRSSAAVAPAQAPSAPAVQPVPTPVVSRPSAHTPRRTTTSSGTERPHATPRAARTARRGAAGGGYDNSPLDDLSGPDVAMAPSAPIPTMVGGPTVSVDAPSYRPPRPHRRAARTPTATPRSEPIAPSTPEPTPPPPAA